MIARLCSRNQKISTYGWAVWPGCLVIMSSWAWAGYALFYDPTDAQTFQHWNIRTFADHWFKTHGWYGLLHTGWFQIVWFVGCWGLGSLGAWLGYRSWSRQAPSQTHHHDHSRYTVRSMGWILFVSVFAMLPQWLVPSMWSSDVYLYSMYGRIAREHRGNPLVQSGLSYRTVCLPTSGIPKIAQPGRVCHASHTCPRGTMCQADPYVTRTPWHYQPSAYGPLAVVLFRFLHRPQSTPADNALFLRMTSGLCLLALGLLVFGLAGSGAMTLCLWSPVSWMESANGGHLEALQMLLVFAALFSLRSLSAWLWAGLCLGLAGSIKITMVIFLVPVALVLWKRSEGWAKTTLFVFLVFSVVTIGYAVMWGPPHPFLGLAMESQKSVHSLLHLVRVGLHLTTGHDLYPVLRTLGLGVVGSTIAWMLWSFVRTLSSSARMERREKTRTEHSTVTANTDTIDTVANTDTIDTATSDRVSQTQMYTQMAEIWLVVTLFALGAFHPWHALVGLCLASLLDDRNPLQRSWLWIAICAPLVYYGSAVLFHHWPFPWLWLLLVPCLIFVLPCGLWIWSKTQKLCMVGGSV